MKRKEFLEELERNLNGLPKEDVAEILDDYKEHFKVGKKKKRKEFEIAESLGDPKEIAKEAKKELIGERDSLGLGDTLNRFFFDVKKTSKKAWKKIKVEIPKAKEKFKDKKNGNCRGWKIFGLASLNILVMVWILIAFYAVIFSLIVAGFSIIVSGISVMAFAIFAFLSNPDFLMRSVSLSALFGGAGLTCLGFLWTIGSIQAGKGLSWLVKKYLKSTKRWTKR